MLQSVVEKGRFREVARRWLSVEGVHSRWVACGKLEYVFGCFSLGGFYFYLLFSSNPPFEGDER